MNTIETILTRRSIRRYTDRPVDTAIVESLLRAAMYAPSARDTRPWHFIVVDDREKLDEIPKFHPYATMLAEAPLAVVVCGDLTQEKRVEYLAQNCAAATQNLLLAAHAAGCGTVWLGVYPNQDRAVGLVDLLNLPDHIVPITMIAVGYPAEAPTTEERYDPTRIHQNGW
jgi:nitroreductase